MLNRRQFSTYLGLTVLGLLTGWLRPHRQVYYSYQIGSTRLDQGSVQVFIDDKPFKQIYMEGLRVSHIHP